MRSIKSYKDLSVLARGASGALLVNLMGLALGFSLQVILARTLGPYEFGSYMYVISWMSILVIVASFGMESTAFRMVAAYLATREIGKLRGLLRRGLEIIILVSLALTILINVGLSAYNKLVPHNLSQEIMLGLIILPLWALSNFNQSALASFKRTVAARFPDVVLKPMMMMLIVLALYFGLKQPLLAADALAIHIVAVSLSLCVGLSILKRTLTNVEMKPPSYETAQWLKTGWSLMLISIVYITLAQFDTIMIGLFRDPEEVGIYAAANRISQFVAFGMQAIYLIAAPMISELYASNKLKELGTFVRQLTYWLVGSSLPIFILLLLLGEWILSLFGSTFPVGYDVLLILGFTQLTNALVGPVGYLLTMSGNEKVALRIVGRALIINMMLNVPLIYRYGAIGAASATCIATIYSNLSLKRAAFTQLENQVASS